MKEIERINTIPNSIIRPEVALLSQTIKKYRSNLTWLDGFSQLGIQKYLRCIERDFPEFRKLSYLPNEFILTLNLLKQHRTLVQSVDLYACSAESVEYEDDSDISSVLSEVNEILRESSLSRNSLLEAFQKLPGLFKVIILLFITEIIAPISVDIYIKPEIEEFLRNNDEPRRVQTNAIKKLPKSIGVDVTPLNRFISGDEVRLRVSPSIKSEIIMTLNFGQSVYVLEKNRSWIKVAIPQKQGETLEGWVFTEYTERFNK
ncbi:SH3 domain-containing protein [Aeromonas rivipollensis]|uniref:SH3 domain-containing protein n=1 Tax=Aeromonas rivipollensis TaxID=948519 RepID=A0ABX0D490_9GAMM|nr:SH3 domain-containing protein [Aeromonas rivipollensis]NEX88177.1 SH3 domain-containing protein [Aeromonas rivipollensis]NEY05671.1 SH3 domain-containing protein [Aeromonas rivipollensis]